MKSNFVVTPDYPNLYNQRRIFLHFFIVALFISSLSFSTTSFAETPHHCVELEAQPYNVCVDINAKLLECDTSDLGDFLDACEVNIDYTVSTNYVGESYVKTFVECAVDLELQSPISTRPQIEEDAQEDIISLFSTEHERTMSFLFLYSHRSEIKEVNIKNIQCTAVDPQVW